MPTVSHRLANTRAVESLAREIARDVILPRYLKTKGNQKADGSLFTEADIESQHALTHGLPQILPGPVLGEEMSDAQQLDVWQQGRDGMWCIDPIDGTTNFASGIPFFAVSIAYLVNYEPKIGVVYNPVTDESFYAAREGGAFLNGTALPLRQPAQNLAAAVAGIDFKRIHNRMRDELAEHPPYYSQRNFGSSALEWCFVAAARLDIYLHGGQKLWDYAAGYLILKEAGGQFAALNNHALFEGPLAKRGVITAATPTLFKAWKAWLSHIPAAN